MDDPFASVTCVPCLRSAAKKKKNYPRSCAPTFLHQIRARNCFERQKKRNWIFNQRNFNSFRMDKDFPPEYRQGFSALRRGPKEIQFFTQRTPPKGKRMTKFKRRVSRRCMERIVMTIINKIFLFIIRFPSRRKDFFAFFNIFQSLSLRCQMAIYHQFLMQWIKRLFMGGIGSGFGCAHLLALLSSSSSSCLQMNGKQFF